LDIQHILQLTNGDREFIVELLETYRVETNKSIISLLSALRNNDSKEIGLIVHKLRPSTQYLKITNLESILREVELQTNPTSQLEIRLMELWEKLEIELKDLITQFN